MVVIVTGGTFGIGRAISVLLAERGHHVVAFGLDARQPSSTAEGGTAALNAEAARCGLPIVALEADVSISADVEHVIDTALARFGRIDALVNNAAIGPLGTILEHDEAMFDRIMDVNVKGVYLCCRTVLPHLMANGGGSIVNIGSGAGWGKPNIFAYATSKGAIFALSQSLAYDFFHDNVRVNTVIPGGGGIPTLNPASEQPLSKETLSMLGRKGMDAGSPIFVRIFKEESELEVWKARDDGRFYHFKTYPICNWSGNVGPAASQPVHHGTLLLIGGGLDDAATIVVVAGINLHKRKY